METREFLDPRNIATDKMELFNPMDYIDSNFIFFIGSNGIYNFDLDNDGDDDIRITETYTSSSNQIISFPTGSFDRYIYKYELLNDKLGSDFNDDGVNEFTAGLSLEYDKFHKGMKLVVKNLVADTDQNGYDEFMLEEEQYLFDGLFMSRILTMGLEVDTNQDGHKDLRIKHMNEFLDAGTEFIAIQNELSKYSNSVFLRYYGMVFSADNDFRNSYDNLRKEWEKLYEYELPSDTDTEIGQFACVGISFDLFDSEGKKIGIAKIDKDSSMKYDFLANFSELDINAYGFSNKEINKYSNYLNGLNFDTENTYNA